MIYKVYCVRDKLNGFMAPICESNEESAIRSFSKACNEVDGSMFAFAPSDFDLYEVASFDDRSGEVKPVSPVKFIVNGSSVYMRKDVVVNEDS